jgi:hypothetical protein
VFSFPRHSDGWPAGTMLGTMSEDILIVVNPATGEERFRITDQAVEDLRDKPSAKWIALLEHLGGGNAVLRNCAKAELISPWHPNCPNECMPCKCNNQSRIEKDEQ